MQGRGRFLKSRDGYIKEAKREGGEGAVDFGKGIDSKHANGRKTSERIFFLRKKARLLFRGSAGRVTKGRFCAKRP